MGKKDFQPSWTRIALFSVVSVGVVWFLSSRVEVLNGKQKGEVKAESVVNEEENDSFFKKTIRVLGDKVDSVIPEEIKQQVHETEEKIFKKTSQAVEENEITKQIKTIILNTVQQVTGEVQDFSTKQKTEIKKEVIRQVCDELIKETD